MSGEAAALRDALAAADNALRALADITARHDARVSELLEVINREVARRREAEATCAALRDRLVTVRMAGLR